MTYRCAHPDCTSRAAERCFDCGKHLCDAHLVTIQVRTYHSALRERVCHACLETHLGEPDRFGPVRVELVPDLLSSDHLGSVAALPLYDGTEAGLTESPW